MRNLVSDAIWTAIMPATTNTTRAVTPATCFALMLNYGGSMLAAIPLLFNARGARFHARSLDASRARPPGALSSATATLGRQRCRLELRVETPDSALSSQLPASNS